MKNNLTALAPSVRFLCLLLLVGTSSAQEYFPENPAQSKFGNEWFSAQLKAFGEEPLHSKNLRKDRESYRFTWMRAFRPPVVLRVDFGKDGKAILTIKTPVKDSEEMCPPLGKTETKELNTVEARRFRYNFNQIKFFDLPSYIKDQGSDGSNWLIEVLVDGRYHVVERWFPQPSPFSSFGRYWIELAIGGDLVPIF